LAFLFKTNLVCVAGTNVSTQPFFQHRRRRPRPRPRRRPLLRRQARARTRKPRSSKCTPGFDSEFQARYAAHKSALGYRLAIAWHVHPKREAPQLNASLLFFHNLAAACIGVNWESSYATCTSSAGCCTDYACGASDQGRLDAGQGMCAPCDKTSFGRAWVFTADSTCPTPGELSECQRRVASLS
jgi:hypothetical protein